MESGEPFSAFSYRPTTLQWPPNILYQASCNMQLFYLNSPIDWFISWLAIVQGGELQFRSECMVLVVKKTPHQGQPTDSRELYLVIKREPSQRKMKKMKAKGNSALNQEYKHSQEFIYDLGCWVDMESNRWEMVLCVTSQYPEAHIAAKIDFSTLPTFPPCNDIEASTCTRKKWI